MKKLSGIVLIILIYSIPSFAQKTFVLKDLFKHDTIVWYGIDYTKARFVGTFTGKDLHIYFHGWNRLPLEESDKYDIGNALHKKVVLVDTAYIETVNDKSTPRVSTTTADSTVTKAMIKDMLLQYKDEKRKQGLGFVIVAASYDNLKHLGKHYVVVFDIHTKKILISQVYECSPGGIGIRNFWAGSIHCAFKLLEDNYDRWKKKYGR